jgi:hypothetical protein
MMGDGAFILLKGGRAGPESTKRAKIRLAILLKILHIVPSEGRNRPANIEKGTWKGCIYGDFCGVWLICQNRPFCYSNHSFSWEIGAVSCKSMQERDDIRISTQTIYIKLLGNS